jgi:hypothetical protein
MHPLSIHGRATPLSVGGGACRPSCSLHSWDSRGGSTIIPEEPVFTGMSSCPGTPSRQGSAKEGGNPRYSPRRPFHSPGKHPPRTFRPLGGIPLRRWACACARSGILAFPSQRSSRPALPLARFKVFCSFSDVSLPQVKDARKRAPPGALATGRDALPRVREKKQARNGNSFSATCPSAHDWGARPRAPPAGIRDIKENTAISPYFPARCPPWKFRPPPRMQTPSRPFGSPPPRPCGSGAMRQIGFTSGAGDGRMQARYENGYTTDAT